MGCEYIEDIAVDEVTPYDVLAEDDTDEHGQTRTGTDKDLNIPGNGFFSFDHMVALGNWAAKNPKRWNSIAIKLARPELTYKQISRLTGRSEASICRDLKRLNIWG